MLNHSLLFALKCSAKIKQCKICVNFAELLEVYVAHHRAPSVAHFMQTDVPDFIEPLDWLCNSLDLNPVIQATQFGALFISWYIARSSRTLTIWNKSFTWDRPHMSSVPPLTSLFSVVHSHGGHKCTSFALFLWCLRVANFISVMFCLGKSCRSSSLTSC